MEEIIKIQMWLAEKGFVILDWKYSPNEFQLSTHFLVNKKRDCVFISLEADLEEDLEFTFDRFLNNFNRVVEIRELELN
jgi:hypothetical protein